MKQRLMLITLSLVMVACNWVEITEEGKAIRIVTKEQVAGCKKLGRVYAQSKDQVAGFDRSEKTLKREIEKLARNTAAASDMDGDTLVPTSPIEKGKQSFDFYKCMRPEIKKEEGGE